MREGQRGVSVPVRGHNRWWKARMRVGRDATAVAIMISAYMNELV